MPCYTGTRDSIEVGKRLYQEQRSREQNDPLIKLWRELARRVDDEPMGFAGLSEPEKMHFAVVLLDTEVCNGGFDQYFFNSSSSYYAYAVQGLQEMGATEALNLLLRAKLLEFGPADVPEDTEPRRKILRARHSESLLRQLNHLDTRYYEDVDGMADLSEAFARRHKLI